MRRDKLIHFWLSGDEKQNLMDSANIAEMSMSAFMRAMCCGTVDIEKRAKLRRITKRAEEQYNNWINLLDELAAFVKEEKKALS